MKKLDKSVQKTLIIVGGILILAILIMVFVNNTTYSKTVSATGISTLKVTPDFVSVYFNIDTSGITAKEASEKNAVIFDDLEKALVAKGLDQKEIQTQSYNVYPNYDYRNGNSVIDGYIASYSLKIQVDVADKQKIGEVIDAGIGAGAGISYLNFEISEENQSIYKIEAIKLATEDAKAKATALAEGSGSELGSLVSVSSSDFNYVPWLAASSDAVKEESGSAIATSINPSEQEISATVTAIFRIK